VKGMRSGPFCKQIRRLPPGEMPEEFMGQLAEMYRKMREMIANEMDPYLRSEVKDYIAARKRDLQELREAEVDAEKCEVTI